MRQPPKAVKEEPKQQNQNRKAAKRRKISSSESTGCKTAEGIVASSEENA